MANDLKAKLTLDPGGYVKGMKRVQSVGGIDIVPADGIMGPHASWAREPESA